MIDIKSVCHTCSMTKCPICGERSDKFTVCELCNYKVCKECQMCYEYILYCATCDTFVCDKCTMILYDGARTCLRCVEKS